MLFDQTWVHSADISDSHHYVEPTPGLLDDWVDPIDYTQGTLWIYLEVLTKPTDQPTRFQVCMEATPTYACSNQAPVYTETGVYEWSTTFEEMWSPAGPSVDWSLGVNRFACILKDDANNKPSADNVGEETAAQYMPSEVRMVVTLVEAGSEYVSPSAMGGSSGGEDESGGDDSTSSAGTGDGPMPSTTGEGPEETGEDTGTPPPSPGSDGSGGEPTSETTAAPASEDGDEAGCGCRSSGSGAPALGWLLLGALGFTRRRARSRA